MISLSRGLALAALSFCLFPVPRVSAQAASLPSAGRVLSCSYAAGPYTNPGSGAVLVAERVLRFPRASFLQIGFDRIELGRGSRLEVISLLDDQKQVWTRDDVLRGASLESYYFNGDALLVRLWAGPKSRGNAFEIRDVAIGDPGRPPSVLGICGSDDRTPWADRRVARIMLKGNKSLSWGTAFLVSQVNCFATAGRCLANGTTSVTVEFNVPYSTTTGALVHPPLSSQYTWEGASSARYQYYSTADWGVFTTQKNAVTKRYPGSVQGAYFAFTSIIPQPQTTIAVTGYGIDSLPTKRFNGIQQSARGSFLGTSSWWLRHRADTDTGCAGAPVFIPRSGSLPDRVIGVDTSSSCSSTTGNSAFRADYPAFKSARAALSNRQPLPDFRPTLLSLSSTTLVAGQTYQVYTRIYNYGTARVNTSSYHGFYVSTDSTISTTDLLVGEFGSATINVGSYIAYSGSVRMPNNLPHGSCWFGVYADHRRNVQEEDELNNTLAKAVTCLTLPDLTVKLVRPSHSVLYPNMSFSITAQIANIGAAASALTKSGHYLSADSTITTADTLLASFSTYPLNPNTYRVYTTTVRAPASLPNATCWVGTYADNTSSIREVSETNNALGVPVTCKSSPPGPDLTVTSLSASPSTWTSYYSVSCTARVQNIGDAGSGNGFYVGFYLSKDATITTSDIFLSRYYVSALGAGAYRQVTTSVQMPCVSAGSWYLGAYADCYANVKEKNEANNAKALPGTMGGKPDLFITYLYPFGGTRLQAGSKVTVRITTMNARSGGTTPAPDSLTGLYLAKAVKPTSADIFLGEFPTGTLSCSGSKTVAPQVQIPYYVAPGSYYLCAWADHTNKVAEKYETNNVRALAVSVTGYSGTGRYVEFQPLYPTAAHLPDTANLSASAGGTAKMAVTAPSHKNYWYLLLWSGNANSFQVDALTNFQLALLNSPIFALWFGRTNQTGGQAFPSFAIPSGVTIPSAFTAYTYSAWFTPDLKSMAGFGTNRITTKITP